MTVTYVLEVGAIGAGITLKAHIQFGDSFSSYHCIGYIPLLLPVFFLCFFSLTHLSHVHTWQTYSPEKVEMKRKEKKI